MYMFVYSLIGDSATCRMLRLMIAYRIAGIAGVSALTKPNVVRLDSWASNI